MRTRAWSIAACDYKQRRPYRSCLFDVPVERCPKCRKLAAAQTPPPPRPFSPIPSKPHAAPKQLEAPHLTATLPLVPPLVSTGTGLAFADEELASVADPEAAAAGGSAAKLGAQDGAACLPPPPANGIVVCAMSARYPPVKKLKKKKKWTPFEEMAGRLATAVSVRTGDRLRACACVCAVQVHASRWWCVGGIYRRTHACWSFFGLCGLPGAPRLYSGVFCCWHGTGRVLVSIFWGNGKGHCATCTNLTCVTARTRQCIWEAAGMGLGSL